MARGKHATHVRLASTRELVDFLGAITKEVPVPPEVPVTPSGHQTDRYSINTAADLPRLSEEAQPWGGATLSGVKWLSATRAPRSRQAPDGRQSGGT
jgi:hypothetical protein